MRTHTGTFEKDTEDICADRCTQKPLRNKEKTNEALIPVPVESS